MYQFMANTLITNVTNSRPTKETSESKACSVAAAAECFVGCRLPGPTEPGAEVWAESVVCDVGPSAKALTGFVCPLTTMAEPDGSNE